jgi:FkbM family methyltransferase
MSAIHIFDNGVKVYDSHLMPAQRERYRERNVHEADEEDLFTEIINAIPSDGCYVNIGAAIGYYVILAKKLSPNLAVHAVEPLERFRGYFRDNLLLNGLSEDDFFIHPYGVSGTDGKTTFVAKGFESRVVQDEDSGFSLRRLADRAKDIIKGVLGKLGVKRYAEGAGEQTVIDTISLDTLVERIGSQVDVAQMDVQGLETLILAGGKKSLDDAVIRTFIVGTHGKRIHDRCIEILRGSGYSIEYEEADTANQPDGIIVASKGVTRLAEVP